MKKFFLASVLASTSAVAGMSLVVAPALQAQAPAASDQVSIKDPAEYNAYTNATTHLLISKITSKTRHPQSKRLEST